MTKVSRAVRGYWPLEGSTCIISSPLAGMDLQVLSLWQPDDSKPEVGDRLHNFGELEEIDRLGDVAVRMQIIGSRHVPGILGRRQHHHGNVSEVWIGFDLCQDLPPALFG